MVPAADSSSDSESSIEESPAQQGDGMDVSTTQTAGNPAETAPPSKAPEVEMEIGLGVFDVNGAVDEEAMRRQNIDIVDEVKQVSAGALIEEVQDAKMEDADGSAPPA